LKKIVSLERLIEELEEIEDLREPWKVKHNIGDTIAITLFATLAKCDDLKDVYYWAKASKEILQNYLELPNGIPGYDTMRRTLALIEPSVLNNFLQKWNELVEKGEKEKLRKILAIDGKTQRGNATEDQKANHIVSAIDEDRICLGQEVVKEKSNEITAIPKLLDKLNIKNHIVTIDAMGAQIKIVEKIIDKKGDYCISLKGNQGNLLDNVSLYFADPDFQKKSSYHASKLEKARGGIEKREYWITTDISWLEQKNQWKGLRSIGMTRNTITKEGKTTVEERFFISSLSDEAKTFAKAVRGHWTIESYHWHLDVTFREDSCKIIDKRAAENLNILRKFAMAILKKFEYSKKISMKTKRLLFTLNPIKMLDEIFKI
jgi:predicted transposase YbfD/YdcC